MKRPVDKTKKSNMKCEHCRFYMNHKQLCVHDSKMNTHMNYWKKCQYFDWKEEL